MKYIFLIGRVLFSLIFIVKPFEHFSAKMVDHASNMGVPMPHIMVPLWGIVAALGGLSILLGYKAKIGAWFLVVFLFPTTFFMHPFWNSDTTLTSIMQGFCFWKNISLLGVSLMLAYTGSGPCSIEKS